MLKVYRNSSGLRLHFRDLIEGQKSLYIQLDPKTIPTGTSASEIGEYFFSYTPNATSGMLAEELSELEHYHFDPNYQKVRFYRQTKFDGEDAVQYRLTSYIYADLYLTVPIETENGVRQSAHWW